MDAVLIGTSRVVYCEWLSESYYSKVLNWSIFVFLYFSQVECNIIQEWSFLKLLYKTELTLLDTMGSMSKRALLCF